ncbi:EAL domain-containing protein [Rhodoferax sp. BLA1]|uniref:EAL domain-containing protein n=1 Tax=Rhodoferax sp. BLA1 TaxID=2576062 RepID=UPI0015D388DC|nr:EAL domain-containing protein [Rhodoferax sp. BLA1]
MQTMNLERAKTRAQLWLSASRDGLVMLLPLTFIRVVITIALNFPWNDWPQAWGMQSTASWLLVAARLDASLGVIMGLGMALCVGNRLYVALKRVESSWLTPMLVNLLCLVNFSVGMVFLVGGLENSLGQSLLLGILTGILTVEVFHVYIRLKPVAMRTVGLDGSLLFRRSFHQLVPAALVCVMTSLVMALLSLLGTGLTHLLQMLVVFDPLRLGGAYALNLLIVFVNQLLWLLGLHGGILVEAVGGNLLAPADVVFDAHLASANFVNTFAYLGGSGATYGLLLAMWLVCKDAQMRRLGKYSVVPAVFNVNEVLVFGLPIIFSPILLMPFLLAPLVCASIALLAHGAGWLVLSGHAVTWSTPIFISGYVVSGGLAGVFTQLVGVLVSTALYWPFVKRLQAERSRVQADTVTQALVQLCHLEAPRRQVLHRFDELGDFARALHADFEAALGTPQVFQMYQPKHDVQGRVCGVEALLRWTHPVHGAIMPAAIINVAEETRLINQIGNWSLETACAALQDWKRQGVGGICMSVNLSPVQLEDASFAAFVGQCLARFGLSPSELELEVTEGRTLATTPQADATLRKLCALGVHLSVDDFGMGSSSLLYMQRFEVSAIKIDGSLTRDVMNNSVCSDIIRSIGMLGKKQGVRVVAEFVETAAQRDKLAQLGCDEFQGYLYSPAINSKAFLVYWHKHEGRKHP